jgi:DNA mismatch endonuclease (patch repair protein)
MSKIRSTNTKPEILVRSYLHSKGFRYRLHDKKLPGRPDIVLLKYRVVIFIHGCFWHAHKHCKDFKIPLSRKEYWIPKLISNRRKDIENIRKLTNLGWRSLIIWECDLKPYKIRSALEKLSSAILEH